MDAESEIPVDSSNTDLSDATFGRSDSQAVSTGQGMQAAQQIGLFTELRWAENAYLSGDFPLALKINKAMQARADDPKQEVAILLQQISILRELGEPDESSHVVDELSRLITACLLREMS